jgi:hypothetical protein
MAMQTDSPLRAKLAAAKELQAQRQREASDRAAAKARRREAFKQILSLLDHNPGLGWKEIKQQTGLSTRVVRDTLWWLVQSEKVHFRPDSSGKKRGRIWFAGRLPEEQSPC